MLLPVLIVVTAALGSVATLLRLGVAVAQRVEQLLGFGFVHALRFIRGRLVAILVRLFDFSIRGRFVRLRGRLVLGLVPRLGIGRFLLSLIRIL